MRQDSINLPDSYGALLRDLKERIQNAQLKAAVAVNRELILLYWDLGARIIARQNEEGWGTKVIDRLAGDLPVKKMVGRGGGDRKQQLKEFQGLTRNAEEH